MNLSCCVLVACRFEDSRTQYSDDFSIEWPQLLNRVGELITDRDATYLPLPDWSHFVIRVRARLVVQLNSLYPWRERREEQGFAIVTIWEVTITPS